MTQYKTIKNSAIKDFFERGRYIVREIEQIEFMLEKAENSAIFPPPRIGGVGAKETESDSVMVNCAHYAIELKNAKIRAEMINSEIENVIAKIENAKYRILLRERYLNNSSWEKVSEKIGYESVKWVRTRLHDNSLEAAEKVLCRKTTEPR